MGTGSGEMTCGRVRAGGGARRRQGGEVLYIHIVHLVGLSISILIHIVTHTIPILYYTLDPYRTIPPMPFNLALLGSGLFATNSYLPALAKESNKEIHLHTIWSRSEKSVTTLAAKAKELGFTPRVLHGEAGLQTIWADAAIEGVSFVLPITTQPELIITALQHGKHVISEKPVGKDVEAAKQLIARYESEFKPKGLVWRVAESESPKPPSPNPNPVPTVAHPSRRPINSRPIAHAIRLGARHAHPCCRRGTAHRQGAGTCIVLAIQD